MVYVRYKGADNYEEESLFCSPVEVRAPGIDGASAMLGHINGFSDFIE